MKLLTYLHTSHPSPRVGVLADDLVHPIGEPGVSLLELLQIGAVHAGGTTLESTDHPVPLTEVTVLAPMGGPTAAPEKIIAIGMNYRDHAAEINIDVPTTPVVFAKYANTVASPGQPVLIPTVTQQVDYEGELAVVIGRTAHRVSRADALDHVAGYAAVNDVSSRDLQFSEGGQWTHSKSLDTFLPFGPYLVTADEVGDPQDLGIRTTVNGERVQDGHTSTMVFDVATLIEFLSAAMTLVPGDVICTGTPPGVGTARTPQLFLHDGDVVTVEVDGLGVLSNPFANAP